MTLAISAVHYRLMNEHRDILPRGGSVLQVGDANWYGDADPRCILELTDDEEVRQVVQRAIDSGNLFNVAKAFYAALFRPNVIHSIDINGADGCFRFDLNAPLGLNREYDLCVNHGTAEHVFNIGQVFRTMHYATKVGGLMIHEAPLTGWIDHGFYTLQPTLFYDLEEANGYELVSMHVAEITSGTIMRVESREHLPELAGKIPNNSILFVVLRKGSGPFRIPMQGVYDGRLSEKGHEAWKGMR